MRICIVGCGAVGSLFAAHLAQLDDVEVLAYDASREHVDAINAGGLRLSGAGDVVGHLRATTDAQALPPCDFGIVATKAMHTEPAIRATSHAFRDGCVATVQNGLGNEETLAAHVERVIRGTTFPAGKILEPGHVQWDVKARRPTEIESITGSLVREAERLGMAAPLHTTLYSLVKAKEASYSE